MDQGLELSGFYIRNRVLHGRDLIGFSPVPGYRKGPAARRTSRGLWPSPAVPAQTEAPGAAGQSGGRGTYKISFSPPLIIHKNSGRPNSAAKLVTDTGDLETAEIIAFCRDGDNNEVTFARPIYPGRTENDSTEVTIEKYK